LLLAGDRHRSVLSDLFSALRIDNRELTERGSVGSPANPTNRACQLRQGLKASALSTAGHHRTDTSTMIQLAVEHEGAVTPIGNKLNELPKEGVFETDHCLPLVTGCLFRGNANRSEGMKANAL
jgi:hypothetical protein